MVDPGLAKLIRGMKRSSTRGNSRGREKREVHPALDLQSSGLISSGHPYFRCAAPSCHNWIWISPTTMAPPKKQKSKPTASSAGKQDKDAVLASTSPYSTFPLSRYASLLGSQTLGLAFTLGMLPRTRVLQPELAHLFGTQSATKTSQDHPQHPWFDLITDSPARTLFWLCAGSLFLVGWGAGSLRLWHVAGQPTPPPTQAKKVENKQKTALGVTIEVPPTPARLLVSASFSHLRTPRLRHIKAMKDSLIAVACAFPVILFMILLFGAPLDGLVV